MKKSFFATLLILSALIGFRSLIINNISNESVFAKYLNPSAKANDSQQLEVDLEIKNDEPNEDKNLLFLLMGVDAKDVSKSKGTRTDTMMLVNFDFETGKIDILSIPRDTRTLVRGKQDKINHAHAYGGPDESLEATRNLLNIDLDYFVKVDYQIVQDLVDSIGGVVVDVPKDMKYKDPTAMPPLIINISKGEQQRLDGEKSLQFLRWRSGYADGDIGRTKAQQYFVKEFIKQAVNPKNILKLPAMAKSYFKNVETNIPMSMIARGILSANKIDTSLIETNTIPGEGKYIDGVSYWIHNEDEMRVIIDEILNWIKQPKD